MSLLQSIVTQVIQNAVNGQNQQNQQHQNPSQNNAGGLGGLLGGLAGQSGGLGGVLGSVLGSTSSQSQSSASSPLESVLGGLLGGQSKNVGGADLGNVLSSVLGGSRSGSGFNKSALLVALLPVVLGYIQKNGGLSGVLAKFNQNGLSNQAQSWVSMDKDNDGLDAGDVARLFGNEEINQVCQKTGASEQEVCQGIAELLPQVMSNLTPTGDLQSEQEANAEIDQILQQLR